jgi:hypothetical protein
MNNSKWLLAADILYKVVMLIIAVVRIVMSASVLIVVAVLRGLVSSKPPFRAVARGDLSQTMAGWSRLVENAWKANVKRP